MPLERGSAATVEMLSHVLLKSRGNHLQYKDKENIPMDLRVYFSRDIDSFVTHYCANHFSMHVKSHDRFFGEPLPKSDDASGPTIYKNQNI